MTGKMFGDEFKQMRTVIERNGKFFFVSTNDTFDRGLETMVFACDASGSVTDWGDLYSDHYDSIGAAKIGHRRVCESFQPSERVSHDGY